MPGLERTSDAAPTLAVGEGGVSLYSLTEVGGFRGFLTDIDPETGEVRERLPVVRIAAGSGLGVEFPDRVVLAPTMPRASPASTRPRTRRSLPCRSPGVWSPTSVLGAEHLWVGSSAGDTDRVQPAHGRRLDEIPIDGTPDALAYSEGSIWVLDSLQSEVIRVDPVEKHVVERIVLPGNPKDIAAGDGDLGARCAGRHCDPDRSRERRRRLLHPTGTRSVRHRRWPRVRVEQRRRGRQPVPHRSRTPTRDADPAWYAVGGRRHRRGRSVRLVGASPTSNSRVRRHGLADAGTTGHDHCTSLPRSRQSILSSAKLPWLFKFARAWTE